MREHPSEAEMQEFALGETKNETSINAHIAICDECKAVVANYRLLFSAIGSEQKPVFEFNLSTLVLEKIQPANTEHSRDRFIFYIGFGVIGLLGIGCYWYREFLSGLLIGFGSLFVYLLLTTAIIVLVFQCVDIYKRYQHKIKSLDFY
jgi:hypothetical protein